ncbi:hypothetical protein H5410_019749 [Solanum commersonii]|uniref:Uncharacterized protein n=1 Tax=Solanum commersonii TaxID=4109 RepID=A0A9J5ZAG0_SOLCO|nr:hypothetical protein H5410_019749 [Solanum commersonii]
MRFVNLSKPFSTGTFATIISHRHNTTRRNHSPSLPFEEEIRRINNHIEDFLNGLNKIKNEEEKFIASKLDDIEKLRMELRFLRTFVLFGNSSLDEFFERMPMNIEKFDELTCSLFYEDEDKLILVKHNMEGLAPLLLEEMKSYLSLEKITEEKMIEYLFKHLHDLPMYRANLLLPLMSDYKILRQITSLLIDMIPLELEVLYISTFKLVKESRSTELQGFVRQILKASPKILQNYLILLQRHIELAVPVNYAPTQGINIMMEFLLNFLIDIPEHFIHRDKFNDMLAHVGEVTRKISILVSKMLKESSKNNINEASFSTPDLLQEIEQMKGDIRQILLKAPESSQLRFPMDDGFLFMNLLLRHLNDLLISNVYSVMLIKKEIGMVKESLEFLRSSFMKVRQTLDDSTSGVVKDCWVRALDVAYEAEHINLIVAEVTSLQLEAKNGDDPFDTKSSDKPIESTSSSFVEATVSHEEEEARIINQLLDEHESKLDVISIVGMPGVGKTTLANKVYNNTLVASYFNVRAWCTISQKYNKSKMMKVMRLSYDHLPYHLKPLLLYFARSRKSKRTSVSKLMQLWMAKGLVVHDIPSKCSLEEVTQSYLDALISSSLIMVDHIKKSESFSVTIKVCYVHDVVHNFCSEKAKSYTIIICRMPKGHKDRTTMKKETTQRMHLHIFFVYCQLLEMLG